jgi:hypothetical protein
MYFLKDRANPVEEQWGTWQSMHKQDLKGERDRLNEEYPPSEEGKPKRFVIGTMR